MAAGSSRVPALIDYLVGLFTGSAALGQATPPVTVFDGPNVTGLDPPLKLFVGLTDPDNLGIEAAATFTQARADLGSATRDETSAIHCVAEAWSGSDSISAVRHSAAAIVAAVETLVRTDTTQFGGSGFAQPGVNVGELLQNNTPTGAIARIPFQIQFRSFT